MKTTSLELSRKLFNVGIKMETYWSYARFNKEKTLTIHKSLYALSYKDTALQEIYPAFTTDELFELLPSPVYLRKLDGKWELNEGVSTRYLVKNDVDGGGKISDVACEALGLLLLTLVEKKII